jgi:hypothetical protein
MTSSTAHLVALESDQVKSIGLGAIIVIVLVGVILTIVVGRIVAKVIILLVAAVLAIALYYQRDQVVNAIDKHAKNCDVTFFGIHVKPSDPSVKKACATVANRPK